MKQVLRNNGLTIALLTLFLLSLAGQFFTGWSAANEETAQHGGEYISLSSFLGHAEFLSTVFENWESEFLQMAAYVLLTAFLFQRGSSESKDPDEWNPEDADPKASRNRPEAPWPVRAGPWARNLYAHSLGLAMALLFAASFVLHWINSARLEAEEAAQHGHEGPTLMEHLGSAQLWFESLQNWQSEFLATAVLVVLSIFLRQRGSPESKPVAAPISATGRS